MVMSHIKLKRMTTGKPNSVLHTPSTPGVGSNVFYQKVIMLHITFKGMEHTEYHVSTYSVLIHPSIPRREQKVEIFFAERSHVAYQNNGNGV